MLNPNMRHENSHHFLAVSEWLLFNLFLGGLIMHLTKIFQPNAPSGYAYGLLFLPPVLTFFFPLPSFKSFSLRLLISLFLPLVLTFFLLWGDLTAWGFVHPSHWDLIKLLAYGLPFQGISLLALAIFLYLERKGSIVLFLILATLLEMLVFSYVKRTWNLAFPLYFASGVLLQFVLRLKSHFSRSQFGPHQKKSPSSRTHSSATRWPRGTGTRFLWVIFIISFTLTLGLNLPILAPVWFQEPLTMNGVLGEPGKGTVPLDRDTLFAWKTNNLGGPWQGDYTPLFYVQGPEPMYWRSETFDYYDPRGWWSRTGGPTLLNISPPIRLNPSVETKTFQVRLLQPLAPGTGLLAPGQLAELSNISLTGTSFTYHEFANTLWSNSILPAKTEYTVETTLPKYSADDLRKAVPFRPSRPPGTSIWTPWMTRNPMPLIQLTGQITQGIENPYDKIQALSNYLRNNMTYDLNPPPPPDGDFVNDFLFNTHKGYCIHFASSLVIMARTLGFTSRLSMGFTYGNRLDTTRSPFPGKDSATVRLLTKNDAHSWAEVYFEGYGWVPFEATPGFSNPQEPYEPTALAQSDPSAQNPTLNNPSNKEKPENQDPRAAAKSTTSLPFYLTVLLTSLGAILLSLFLFFFLRRFRRQRRWQAMSGHERLASLYQDLLAQTKKYGLAPSPSATPAEFLRQLPLHTGEWNRLWTEAISLAEKGLYAPGTGEKEVEALLLLKPQLLRLLRAYKKHQRA